MEMTRVHRSALLAAMAFAACTDAGSAPAGPAAPLQATFTSAGKTRPTVLVNPHGNGNGTATTIQQGIEMVSDGGRVLVLPGVYAERLTIDRGLTLEPVGHGGGPVVIEQILATGAPGTEAVIQVTTHQPVILRDVAVHHVHLRGLNIFTAADVTIENVSFLGEWPSSSAPVNNGVSVANNATLSGDRARLVVRGSRFDVDGNAVSLGGDVTAVIEDNVFSQTRGHGACIGVSPTGQGVTVPAGSATNVDIVHNELNDCGANVPLRTGPVFIAVTGVIGAATTGTVNIIGNTLRNTVARTTTACNTGGIVYEFFSGRIEHNRILDVVQPCATAGWNGRSLPSAVFVGSLVAGMRPADVIVRFNDFDGNAYAGLRIGPNQSTALDATCNWWGHPSGPGGVALGLGNALLTEGGASVPRYRPFALSPVATETQPACPDGS